MSEHKHYRDASTGEYVTEAEADARPAETVAETDSDPAAGEVAGDVSSGWLDPADPDTAP